MITNEKTKATGMVNIVVSDSNGKVKQEVTVPNLVVTTGLNFIASRMEGTDADIMSHMAVGTDDTAAAVSDTALLNEEARVSLDSGEATGNDMVYTATYPAGTGTASLTEAGIFNDATAGTMLCRTVFAVINKGAADSMTVTWTITIS